MAPAPAIATARTRAPARPPSMPAHAAPSRTTVSFPAPLARRASAPCACGGQCPRCQGTLTPPAALDGIQTALSSPGQSLAPAALPQFNRRFAHDFSAVRVHTDAPAARTARRLRAKAFTVGNNIVFSEGHYAPDTPTGQNLLAHELAHVVQQSHDAASLDAPGPAQEAEAGNVARESSASASPVVIHAHSAVGVARTPESLGHSLNADTMSDDEIRTELREIKLWLAGQVTTNDDSIRLEREEELLLGQLTRRHQDREGAERARNKASAQKPKRKGKAPAKPAPAADVAPADVVPAPRAATGSFNPADLSAGEKADELQRTEEWLALKKKSDWRTKAVQESRKAVSGELGEQQSAPMKERHNLTLTRVDASKLVHTEVTGLNRFEAIKAVRRQIEDARNEAGLAIADIDMVYDQRNDMPIRSRVAETMGGASHPSHLLDYWSDANDLLRAAEDALEQGNFARATELSAASLAKSNAAVQGVKEYFGDTVKGGERTVTGLKIVKTAAAATVTIGTGGTAGIIVGGAYAGTQSLAEQASEIHYGLRDKIDWAGVAFDTAVGAVSGYFGGKLGNAVLTRLLAKGAGKYAGTKFLSYAVADYIAGRAGSTLHLTARTAFDAARGQDITWEQFVDQLADQITDPKQAAFDIILGHASRSATAARSANEPAPAPASTPAPSPSTPAQAYAARFNGRLVADAGLEGVFDRTSDQPTLSVDRRAAASELRTINDILTEGYNGQPVARLRVLPPTNQQRTPDLVLEFADGSAKRVEIRAMTSAPKGHSNPHAPLAAATQTRSGAVTQSALEGAIEAKARDTAGRPSQLTAPLPNVASGGRIAINITHSPLSPATADAAVLNLTPRLGAHVESISITFPDAASGRRTTLIYNRQNGAYVRSP